MSIHQLRNQEANLDRLFQEVSNLDDGDVNKAHLTRYLCVRTSGYLEVVIKYLIADLCDGTSPQTVRNFVQKKSKYITNLSFKKTCEVLSEFDSSWAIAFENVVTDEQKASMNSVISNRNNISHGNQDNTSFRDMKQYYQDIKDVTVILKGIMQKKISSKK